MMIFNVFGRLLGVKRIGDEWRLFRVTLPERKYAPSHDIVLPADLREEEIAGYLGIFITRPRRRSGRTCFASNSAARYSSALRAMMRRWCSSLAAWISSSTEPTSARFWISLNRPLRALSGVRLPS